jgi:STE20-like kinase
LERYENERQQLIKTQLQNTFLLQKQQMYNRHDRELEQLKRYHECKVAELDRSYAAERKLLPKKLKSESVQRRKDFKNTHVKLKSDLQSKLLEFDAFEVRRIKHRINKLDESYNSARSTLLASIRKEIAQLQQLQASKKEQLCVNEDLQLKGLEVRQADEIRDCKATCAAKESELCAEFAKQLDELREAYKARADAREKPHLAAS